MPRLIRAVPKYRVHRPSGQAVVTLDGRDHYVGRAGSEVSRREYDRLIAEWLANNRSLPDQGGQERRTVAEVIAAFMQHADRYYRHPDGTPTGEADNYNLALRPLLELYGHTPAADFGPRALWLVRQRMIEFGWARTHINRQVSRVRSLFQWAASMELLPAGVHERLTKLDGLRNGRTEAHESAKVRPVSDADVDAVLPFLGRQLRAMVQLQRLCAARPGEITAMRPVDIDTSRPGQWVYSPPQHKTQHHELARSIHLGPRAIEIIRPFLCGRSVSAYLFSPSEADAERRAELLARRTTPLSCGNKPGSNRRMNPKRTPGDRYTTDSYRRAIRRACERAGIPAWHPHQLRHTTATAIRRRFGIDAARVVLGHARLSSAEVYAERDDIEATQIMQEIG